MKQTLLLILVVALLSSCSDKSASEDSHDGVITYSISYPDQIKAHALSTFLPGEMTAIFKENDYKLHIKGELNLYNLEYISKSKGDTCFTLLRVWDKKLYYPQKEGEELFLFNANGQPKITFQKDSTKLIAGYNCKMGTAVFPDRRLPAMKFYYTEDINFKAPNANTPFKDVPGPMLEFNINFQGMDISFAAKTVKIKQIKDDEFKIPESYREADSNEINEIVSSLLLL
ncbi:hypothetical protein [Carboxylicivirga linearis]|uniref:Lipoprotein n=1 Tax=Carboxylicivirga linearis TaxID=1628157 RepID=A0ABS5JR29_9BACT|nr:hypothetical protein [Carboxylicivirga linearis]MBS2097324.1 hypothetical protein [Carboxylicivirga linearis]